MKGKKIRHYGPEWEKKMQKWNKKELIAVIKKLCAGSNVELLETLNIARIAIDTAIYTEDGLDGGEGEELINSIEKILTRHNVEFTPVGTE